MVGYHRTYLLALPCKLADGQVRPPRWANERGGVSELDLIGYPTSTHHPVGSIVCILSLVWREARVGICSFWHNAYRYY